MRARGARAPSRAGSAVAILALLFLAFGGYVKGLPALAGAGDTLTRLSALTVLVACLQRVLRGHAPPVPLVGVLILGLTFVPALLVPYPTTYTIEKVTVELPLMFLAILGGLLLLSHERARRQWMTAVVIMGAIVAILARAFPSTIAVNALAVEGANTISEGRATGAAAVTLLTLALVHDKGRLPLLAGAFALAASMLASGSRGPAIGAMVAVVLAVSFSPGRGRALRVVAAVVSLLSAAYLAFAANLVADRLLTFEDTSAEARRRLWHVGVGLIGSNPLGIGWGQLRTYLPAGSSPAGVGFREYPHNVLIEVGSEAGVLALVALVVVLALALRGQQREARQPVESVMLALLIFALVNALVSGDVGDNRGLWVAVGAGLATLGRLSNDAPLPVETHPVSPTMRDGEALTSSRSAPWPN
jgi:O-antigen ligase